MQGEGGWTVERRDERGEYLVKEVSLPSRGVRIVIRCAVVPSLSPSVCLRMFSVSPLRPGEAEVIESLFGGSLAWYYRDEEGGKVYFWAKGPDKVRFSSLRELEEAVVSSVEAALGGASRRSAEEGLVADGWLIHATDAELVARRSERVDGKLLVVEVRVDRRGGGRVAASVKVLGVTEGEGSAYRERLREAEGFRVSVLSTSPVFHAQLTRAGVSRFQEETLIRELYNLALGVVKR